MSYTTLDGHSNTIAITYLPTGELAHGNNEEDIAIARNILEPARLLLQLLNPEVDFDIFMILNWYGISGYWFSLLSFGQFAPVNYIFDPIVNFSKPILHSTTNNIFLNGTLFDLYTDYLRQTVVPLFSSFLPFTALPEIQPLGQDNPLEVPIITFASTYSCSQRQMKSWFSFIISVAAADYALLAALYSGFITIIGWHQQSKKKREPFLPESL